MGFGPIAAEQDEPYFHASWEERALGVTLCCGALGLWNIDESRHSRENLHPADYYASSYYEIWIKALETLLIRHDCVTLDDLKSGISQSASRIEKPPLKPENVAAVIAAGGPCERAAQTPARYEAGTKVRVRNIHPSGHTRIPGYAKGHIGVVEEVAGVFVFPDDNAHGKGENAQWLYRVVLNGQDLWGAGSDPTLSVSIDAWESYLEPA